MLRISFMSGYWLLHFHIMYRECYLNFNTPANIFVFVLTYFIISLPQPIRQFLSYIYHFYFCSSQWVVPQESHTGRLSIMSNTVCHFSFSAQKWYISQSILLGYVTWSSYSHWSLIASLHFYLSQIYDADFDVTYSFHYYINTLSITVISRVISSEFEDLSHARNRRRADLFPLKTVIWDAVSLSDTLPLLLYFIASH